MKRTFLFIVILAWPGIILGQSFTNPDTIHQHGDIIIQNTNVYYCPVTPPSDTDTRAELCNESDLINDPNGVGSYWRDYDATTRDSLFWMTHPCTDVDHPNKWTVWMRLFQALDKPDGTHSNIIADSGARNSVIISKNEDVDFRASGRVILKSGFHVKPGAFFHAYTDPQWDTAVFSDEFDNATKFDSQWYIGNGYGGGTSGAPATEVLSDSNVRLVSDPDAHDGHALDLMMIWDTVDTFSGRPMNYSETGRYPIPNPHDTLPFKSFLCTAFIRSYPFPYAYVTDSIGPPAYDHSPYGKYEFRDKIPHTLHHTNNWGGTWDMEYDIDETPNATMGTMAPGLGHPFLYGPDTGFFKYIKDSKRGDSTWGFISADAGWTPGNNNSTDIVLNGFDYKVNGDDFVRDTCRANPGDYTALSGGFPSSLIHSGLSYPFYCHRYNWYIADLVTWTLDSDATTHRWDVFRGPYHVISPSDSVFFYKDYQPVQIKLTMGNLFDTVITLSARWDHTLNAVLLNPYNDSAQDAWLALNTIHSHTEAYSYQIVDLYTHGYGYPTPEVLVDRDTVTPSDTSDYARTPYRYHTFAMEFLPHEIRYLYDSVVVRRIPDRLIPRGNKYYDIISQEPRSPANLIPAEFDGDLDPKDPFGIKPNYTGQYEREFFFAHVSDTTEGFGDVMINGKTYHAAHHLLDYVKVFDVPKDVTISGYPK